MIKVILNDEKPFRAAALLACWLRFLSAQDGEDNFLNQIGKIMFEGGSVEEVSSIIQKELDIYFRDIGIDSIRYHKKLPYDVAKQAAMQFVHWHEMN